MMEARAVVIAVEGGRARVNVAEHVGGCGRCDEPGGCRATRLTDVFKGAAPSFELDNHIGVRAGDRVRLIIPDGAPLTGALASYGLGVLLLIVGALLGRVIGGDGDGAALLGALAGLAFAVVGNRALHRSRGWRRRLVVEMVRDDADEPASCAARTRVLG